MAFWPSHPPPRREGLVCSSVLVGQGERLRVLGSAPTGQTRRLAQGHAAQAAPRLLTTSHLHVDKDRKASFSRRFAGNTLTHEHPFLARERKELVLQPQEEMLRQPGSGEGPWTPSGEGG